MTALKDGEEGSGTVFGDAILSDQGISSAQNINAMGALGTPITGGSEGGQMQGLNTAFRVRYDFLGYLFARIGFVYDYQMSGGEQSYTILNNATAAATNPLFVAANKYYGDAAEAAAAIAELAGKTVNQTWTYGYWAIPVTIGINVPVTDKFNVYAGIGLTYYSGFWQLEMDGPAAIASQGYTDADSDPDTVYTGSFKESCKFEAAGIGFNWTIGASAEVYAATSIFVELDATTAGDMANARLKSSTGQAALNSTTKIYYPVNLSNMLVRFGASYRLPVAI